MGSQSLEYWLWYSVRRAYLDRDLNSIRGEMRGRVLEVGSGQEGRRGAFVPPMEETAYWITTDIDLARGPEVIADAQFLPFSASSFDALVCLEVMEYLPLPTEALKEFHRVLADQGRLIVSVPFFHRCDAATDFWRYTENGLRSILLEAGFCPSSLLSQGAGLGVAANILKNGIYGARRGWIRTLMACLGRPLISLLWRLDEGTARRVPILASYSTGYLCVAQKSSKG